MATGLFGRIRAGAAVIQNVFATMFFEGGAVWVRVARNGSGSEGDVVPAGSQEKLEGVFRGDSLRFKWGAQGSRVGYRPRPRCCRQKMAPASAAPPPRVFVF